ncbi:MAG: nucleotidyltransferase domain-containing protein [Oscillospiraceae bacterium]|jgi:predicted nucleotidyltransferase|nr:nucleotidyltransferase domain-containing protein [Oscillospiraceae bacterium]
MPKIYRIEELRAAVRPIFARYPVYAATLFGSYARGEATERSDVDIVIDTHCELLDVRFYAVQGEIQQRLGIPVDLFEVCSIRRPSPIAEKIDAEGVRLYER